MNGYTSQSPELSGSMMPPSVGRRIKVVDFSIKQVVMATESIYQKALSEQARDRSRYAAPVAPIASSVRVEHTSASQSDSNLAQPAKVIQFPVPDQSVAQGEVVNTDQKNMIEEANKRLDEAYGDSYVAA